MAVGGARWDRPALSAGLLTAAVIGVAATALGLAAGSGSPWRSVTVAVTMLGFVLGAATAAWAQRAGTPFHHGVIAALGAYVAVEAVFLTIAVVRGRSISVLGLLLKVTLVVAAGVVGGFLGSLARRRGFVPAAERSES